MSIPHRCPICEGRGEVGKRLAQVGAVLISEKPQRFRCHGCMGTGIVWDQTFTITPPQPFVPIGPTWGSTTIDQRSLDAAVGRNPIIGDGVAKCPSCNEPLYMEPAKGCQRTSSHTLPSERVL